MGTGAYQNSLHSAYFTSIFMTPKVKFSIKTKKPQNNDKVAKLNNSVLQHKNTIFNIYAHCRHDCKLVPKWYETENPAAT